MTRDFERFQAAEMTFKDHSFIQGHLYYSDHVWLPISDQQQICVISTTDTEVTFLPMVYLLTTFAHKISWQWLVRAKEWQ